MAGPRLIAELTSIHATSSDIWWPGVDRSLSDSPLPAVLTILLFPYSYRYLELCAVTVSALFICTIYLHCSRQVALADVILLNKMDLVSGDERAAVSSAIR